MKIVIYGDIGGSGGYVRYCKGLLITDVIPNSFKVWFVCSPQFLNQIAPLNPDIKIITHSWMASKNRFQRYLWQLWIYPRLIKKIKPDIEFYPSGQRRVYFRNALTITTCHNLLLFDKKELDKITDATELSYFKKYREMQTSSFFKSNGVIFLSKYSQQFISKEIGLIKSSTIIAHGLDPMFLVQKERSYELTDKIKLLYVSPYFHYKHQMEVVNAVELLRASTGLDICLQLIGGGNSSAASQLDNYIKNHCLGEFIFVKGNVPYVELIKEYCAADIFIFASSCETFGITILEAMGTRLPIACSNRSGLYEILKDAGEYFDPEDPKSIADAIQKLISDIELRTILGEKAYGYAIDYTWERCASETYNYIKKIKEINDK